MAAWATETRTQHGLETGQKPMYERNGATELNSLADEAKRRAEIARSHSFFFCLITFSKEIVSLCRV